MHITITYLPTFLQAIGYWIYDGILSTVGENLEFYMYYKYIIII